MRPFMTMTRVEVSLLLREPAALFFTLALPLLLLILNGSGGGNAAVATDGARDHGFGALGVAHGDRRRRRCSKRYRCVDPHAEVGSPCGPPTSMLA